jgi:hypothetical protein
MGVHEQYPHQGMPGFQGTPSSPGYGMYGQGSGTSYGGQVPGYGLRPGTPGTLQGPTFPTGGAYVGTNPTGAASSPWTMPQRLVGADPSSGTKGQLWGIKAHEDLSMLNAWSPPGMPLEKLVRFGDQTLDAVGIPGTSTQGSDDFEMARLSDAFMMMAAGRTAMTHSLLQGTTDNGFKQEKRTTLGNIKSAEELDTRLQCLSSNKDKVLEHVEGNLKIVLMGAGYTPDDAALLAHDSPLLRISTDSVNAYIGLHMHLLAIALRHGWDHSKIELGYHVTKLKEIRALYQTPLQIIAHNYCYLASEEAFLWVLTAPLLLFKDSVLFVQNQTI